jgi:hypothetical protein
MAPEAESRKKVSRTLIALIVVAIVAASTLTYLASSRLWMQKSNRSRENVSIMAVSLRASSSRLYYPTLFASLSVSSALSNLTAFVNGVRVYNQYLSQQNISVHDQGFGTQVKNVSVVLGREYAVTFKAIFEDGIVDTVSTTVTAKYPAPSYISVDVWELCSKNCGYPSPFFEALVAANSSVPLVSLHLYLNGTSQAIENNTWQCCLTAELWKSGIDNRTLPIIAGRTYLVRFVATFQDNTTYAVTKSVIAS